MKSSRRRFRVLGLALALIAPVLGVGAEPAHAATVAAGAAVFEGTATLPKFPCQPPPPYGNGPCVGSFKGQWAGQLAGVHGTSPFEVTWSTLEAATSQLNVPNFDYSEWQCAAGAETVLGIAQGFGSAVVNPGQLQGKYQVVGESFARDIIGIQFNFYFRWTRLGNAALVVLDDRLTTLQINVAGLGWRTIITGVPEAGVAEFVPTQEENPGGVPSCNNQLTNVTGSIAGSLPFAGAS